MVVMVVANEGQRFKILVPKVLYPPSLRLTWLHVNETCASHGAKCCNLSRYLCLACLSITAERFLHNYIFPPIMCKWYAAKGFWKFLVWNFYTIGHAKTRCITLQYGVRTAATLYGLWLVGKEGTTKKCLRYHPIFGWKLLEHWKLATWFLFTHALSLSPSPSWGYIWIGSLGYAAQIRVRRKGRNWA